MRLVRISPTSTSTYFKNIIDIWYSRLHRLIIWSERDIVYKTMPLRFKETFQNKVTVIIDCFEVFIEKPSNLLTADVVHTHLTSVHEVVSREVCIYVTTVVERTVQ